MASDIDAYVNQQVANGVPRESVLASFAKSSDPELKKYAGVPEEKTPVTSPPAPVSTLDQYLGIAKDMVKGNEVPLAVGGTGAAAYLAYKAGQRNAVAPPTPHEISMQEASLRKANANAGIAEANLQKLTAVKPPVAQGITQPVGQSNLTLEAAANRKMPLPTPAEMAAPTPVEKIVGTTAATIDPVNPTPPKPVDLPPPPPPAPELAPVAKAEAMLGKDAPSLTPEITGKAGAAVKPSVTEKVAELNQRIQPLPAPTEKELAFAEKQLKAGKELPLVESRRSPVEKAIFDEEKKLNAAQRQLATQLGGDKVPETEWRSFQDEVYGKNPPKSGAKGGGVPEWDSVVKTAKENPKKYPAIVSAIENIEKKYPKQSGKANIGMLMSLAGNLLGGIGIAKALKEGDTATAGLGAIDQLLANTAMLAGKKGALGAIGSAAGRLSPFMIGMTPTAVSSGTLNSPEAQALFRNARPTGAVPPP